MTDRDGQLIYRIAGSQRIASVDANGALSVSTVNAVPPGASVQASSSGGAQANNSSLSGAAAKTTYIAGFAVTGAGATGASVITVTVTGVATTMNFSMAIPAGAAVAVTPLVVNFATPVPASAVNTAVVVNVPSFGAGNTNAASSAWGFQL